MKTAQLASKFKTVPSNISVGDSEPTPLCIVIICWATTDRTSKSMRLNSSKQDHAPQLFELCKNFER